MTYTQAVANTFLYNAFKENIDVTPMKLQKLTYFLYREYAHKTQKKLFSEPFEVWKYGPVVPSIYYEFQAYHKRKINKFARSARGEVQILDLSNETLNDCFNTIWKKYKHYSGSELSAITHRPGTAWTKAAEANLLELKFEDILLDEEY